MAWSEQESEQFGSKVRELWPQAAQEERRPYVRFLARKLAEAGYKLDGTIAAIEGLRAAPGAGRRIPELADIEAGIRKQCEDRHGAGAGATHREILINRLDTLGSEWGMAGEPPHEKPQRPMWLSPKGKLCEITVGGLIFQRKPDERAILVWADIPTEDLERILADNEKSIKRSA